MLASACCSPAYRRFNSRKCTPEQKREKKSGRNMQSIYSRVSCIYFFSSSECVVLLIPLASIELLFVRIVELKKKHIAGARQSIERRKHADTNK